MYLIFRFSVVILILYLKLNGLRAIPLIDRHKSSSLSALTLFTIKPHDESRNINTNPNNNTNKSTPTTPTTATTITTTKILSKIVLTNNPNAKLTIPAKISQANSDNHRQLFWIDYTLMNNNSSSNSSNKNGSRNVYYYYNVDDNNNKDGREFEITNDVSSKNSTISPLNNDFLTFYSRSLPKVEYSGENSLQNNDGDVIVDDDDKENDNGNENGNGNNDDNEPNLSNILLNTFNDSDVDRFLIKYDNDDGNICFLDVIKESLMWWSNKNGTLQEEAIFNVTRRHSYLDLSYRNISQDDSLYKTTRSHKYYNGPDIIVFSAAQNNLTHAPYRTLLLLNGTLKYLTLKGNQFAAYTTEMQKDALSRFINDTSRHNDPDTHTTIETQTTNEENNSIWTTPMVYPDNTNSNSTTKTPTTLELDNLASNKRRLKNYKRRMLGNKDEGIAWATFPLMPALTELDISNCHIEFITRDAFKNLTNLRRLFIAHNKMLTIPHDTFLYTPSLQYLDLSFTNVLDSNYQIPMPTIELVYNLIYGVKIQQFTFRHLPELVYLDLSHTKLTRNSAVAFTHLSDKLRYMSLCYTAFPMVGNALFKNTALVGLDLSGNAYAAYNIIEDAFEGVARTLKYLYFERSNIKNLAWLKYLSNLRVLGLSGNNINSLSLDVFTPLKSLQLLDLSSNHIGNWYNRVFTKNEQLRLLSLRDNNINIITSEMLRDFQLLDYLSLGDNNFVCDCLLRDLADIAAANNKEAECSHNVLQDAQEILSDNAYLVEDYIPTAKRGYRTMKPVISRKRNGEVEMKYDVSKLLMQRYQVTIKKSVENIKSINRQPKVRVVSHFYRAVNSLSTSTHCPEPNPVLIHDKLNSSTLKFQLLDYEDEHYWCFNETERMHFKQLNCRPRNYVDDIERQLHKLTKYVVGSVCSVIIVSLIGVLIYLKRWHIHYYFSYLKSAALVSVAAKEAGDQLNALAESDPNLVYDIFISYCQSDRQWVVEELLPNVEESGDVSICMHERDFQIGLTILDNIVSCMDRSRALMLIISSNFLLSHWCQFEMHLAQHRIFEVSKDHLILVFLEDIPRNKRPKTLQYLMEVKTYIKWPYTGKTGDRTPSADERKFFWKRLKRSLENIGLHPHPHPRESQA